MAQKSKLYQSLSKLTLNYWWAIILVSVLLTAAATHKIKDLQFKSNFLDLLPSHFDSIRSLDEIKKRAGGEGYFIVVFEGGDIEKIKPFTEKFVSKIKDFKEISYVDYKVDKEFFEARNLLYIDVEDLKTLEKRLAKKITYERNHHNPFYIDLMDEIDDFTIDDIKEKYTGSLIKDYYITKDPQRLVVLVKPTGFASDLAFCKKLLEKTKQTLASLNVEQALPGTTIKYTGRYLTQMEESQFMLEDLKRTSFIALFGVLLLLVLFTRQKTAPIMIGVPLLISIVYALAFAAISIGYLNVVSSILIGVLAGMGIDFGIHMYLRYLEERKKHKTVSDSIYTIQSATGKPVAMAGLTTSTAFFVLSPSNFLGFSQFGLVCGSGIIFCLINTYFLLPSLLILREKISPITSKVAQVPTPDNFVTTPKKYPKPLWTLACAGLVLVLSVWGLFNLSFDYDFRKLSADKYGTLALQEEITEYFGVSLSPTVVYAPEKQDLPALANTLDDIIESQDSSTIKKSISLYTYVPKNQQEKIPHLRNLAKLANDKVLNLADNKDLKHIDDLKIWGQAKAFDVSDLPKELVAQFKAINGYPGSFLYIFPAVDLWQGKEVMRFATEIKQFEKAAKPYKIHLASEAVIFSDILTLIKTEGPLALFASAFAVFLFLLFDLARIRSVLLVMTPLIVGILGLVGAMFVFDINLNFINCIIFPIILGMGIDSGLHIYHRYQEAGPGSLRFVIRHTGGAVLLSSLTTMIGFGALIFASHRGMASFGLLAVIGLTTCLVASITVLPALLQIIENRTISRRITQSDKTQHRSDEKRLAS